MNWVDIFITIIETEKISLQDVDWYTLLTNLDHALSLAIENIKLDEYFSEALTDFLSTPLSLQEKENHPKVTYKNFNAFLMDKNHITSFPKLKASIQQQELLHLKKQMRFLLDQNQLLTLKVEALSQESASLKQSLMDTQTELSYLKHKIEQPAEFHLDPIIKLDTLDELIQKKIHCLNKPTINEHILYTNDDFFNYQKNILAIHQEMILCLSQIKMNLDKEHVKFNSQVGNATIGHLTFLQLLLKLFFDRLEKVFLINMMFSSKKIDTESPSMFNMESLNRLVYRFHEAAGIQEKNNKKDISAILYDIATLLKKLPDVHSAILNCTVLLNESNYYAPLTREQFDYLNQEEASTTEIYAQLVHAIKTRSKEVTVILHEDPVMYSKKLLKTELETLILQLKLNPSHHSTGQAVAKLSGEAAAAFIPVVGSFVNTAVGLSINLSQERDKNQNIQHMRGLTDDIIRDALNFLIESLSLWAPQIHLLARAHRVSQENIRGQKNEFTQKLSCFFHQAKETLLKKQALSYPPYVDFIRLITEMVKMYFNTRETIVGVSVNAKSLYQEIICHLFTCEITLFDQLSKILNLNLIAVPVSENAFQEISLDKLLQGCPLQDEFGACYLIQKADGKFITQEACYHFPLSTNSKTQLSYILAAQNFSIIPKHFLDSGNDIYR
jgi:hypothetical protein